jgi:hypothetical protein
MPWNVTVAVNRSTTLDVVGQKWYLDNVEVGDTPQTAVGVDPSFTYSFPEADRTPLLEVAFYDDAAPTPNLSPRVGLSQNFDAEAPAAPVNFRFLSAVFVV